MTEPASPRSPREPSAHAGPGAGETPPTARQHSEPINEPLDLEPTGEPETPHDETGLDLAAIIAAGARGQARRASRRPKRAQSEGVHYSSARSDARDPQPLGVAFNKLAEQRGWQTDLSVRALFAQWDRLVGETIAEHCRPMSFEDGVVEVRCTSTAWATQLRLLAPNLVARLNDELGHGTVTRLTIKGPDAPSWKHGIRAVSDGRGPRDTYG